MDTHEFLMYLRFQRSGYVRAAQYIATVFTGWEADFIQVTPRQFGGIVVYARPVADFLALRAVADSDIIQVVLSAPSSVNARPPNLFFVESRTLCLRLLVGDPESVSLLYNPVHTEGALWDRLRGLRKDLVTREYVQRLVTRSQEKYNRILYEDLHRETAADAYRLLAQGTHALRDAPLSMDLEDRVFLKATLNGNNSHQEIKQKIVLLASQIEQARPWSLPATADEAMLRDWLQQVRHECVEALDK